MKDSECNSTLNATPGWRRRSLRSNEIGSLLCSRQQKVHCDQRPSLVGGRLRCYVAYSIDVGPLLPCSHASPRTSAVAAKSMPYVLCCNVIVEWVRALLHHVNVSDRLLVRSGRVSFLVVHAELHTGVATVYDHGLSHSVILCCIVFVQPVKLEVDFCSQHLEELSARVKVRLGFIPRVLPCMRLYRISMYSFLMFRLTHWICQELESELEATPQWLRNVKLKQIAGTSKAARVSEQFSVLQAMSAVALADHRRLSLSLSLSLSLTHTHTSFS